MNSKEYDSISEGYYYKAFKEGSSIQKLWHFNKFILTKKRIKFGDDVSILDVGCGPGTFFTFLQKEKMKQAIGIDIAKKQIQFANKNFGTKKIKFLAQDILTYKPKMKFDYIVSTELLEHLTPDYARKLLIKIKSLLKPNGKIILTTPDFNSTWPLIEIILSKVGEVDYTKQHIYRLNRKKATKLFRSVGLKVKHFQRFNMFSPFLGAISERIARKTIKLENSLLEKTGNIMLFDLRK